MFENVAEDKKNFETEFQTTNIFARFRNLRPVFWNYWDRWEKRLVVEREKSKVSEMDAKSR